ncbi:hypothetical protein OG985_03890 [Streptomyces sp. NBC_00289]|uniref:hypothetical protein n=1 Tax=Streptomyces sp. NBC_00289 TaxID=2975703 RepID=UPI003247F477
MALLEFSDRLPQCSRCRGNRIIGGVAPQDDEQGRPVYLGLRVKEGAGLLMEWTKECTATHGWYLPDTPPDQP